MINYYLVKQGYLLGTGTCQKENIDSIFSDGADVVFGIPPSTLEPFPVDASIEVLTQRYTLLSASDWTQLPDVPLATKSAWVTYRQALRDITEQPGYPVEVIWPSTP